MKKLIIVILIVFPIISNNCKGTKASDIVEIVTNETQIPLKFIKEKEVKIDALIKGSAVVKKIAGTNNMFVEFVSERDTSVWKYDRELELKDKFLIPYGQGPDECLVPMVIGGYNHNTLVYDVIAKKYYNFDENFKVNKTFHAKRYDLFLHHSYGYSPENNTIVSGFGFFPDMFKEEYRLFTRKIAGEKIIDRVLYKFLYAKRTKDELFILGHPFHFKLIGEHIFILKTDEYRIIKMDLNGRVLKQARIVNALKRNFSEMDRKNWVKESGMQRAEEFIYPEKLWSACWIMELKDGFAVGRRINYKPIKVEWIEADYFDYDLNYLGKINVPGFPQWNDPYEGQQNMDFLFSFQNDKLFSLVVKETEEGEDFWLTRWRIENEKR